MKRTCVNAALGCYKLIKLLYTQIIVFVTYLIDSITRVQKWKSELSNFFHGSNGFLASNWTGTATA